MEQLARFQGHLELLASDDKVLSIAFFDSEADAQAEMSIAGSRTASSLGPKVA